MANILVVEDDDALRRVILLNLARRGYSVAEADSVATANEALRVASTTRPFDLILLDINLPDETGWDVLRHMADTHSAPRPRVIVMTAVRPARSRLDEFHPDALLLKPFPLLVLFDLVERTLARQSGPDDAGKEEQQGQERQSPNTTPIW